MRKETCIAEHDTQAEPVVVQLAYAPSAPGSLSREKLVYIERGLALHIINGTAEFWSKRVTMPDPVFFLGFSQVLLAADSPRETARPLP